MAAAGVRTGGERRGVWRSGQGAEPAGNRIEPQRGVQAWVLQSRRRTP